MPTAKPDIGGEPEPRATPQLRLVPCNHFWLAMFYGSAGGVVAICKHYSCRKRIAFSRDEWDTLKAHGIALDKPARV